MSRRNKISTRCFKSCWWGGWVSQAVTGAPLVAAQFKGGRHPVAAGGERLVGSTESSLRECSQSVKAMQSRSVMKVGTNKVHFTLIIFKS